MAGLVPSYEQRWLQQGTTVSSFDQRGRCHVFTPSTLGRIEPCAYMDKLGQGDSCDELLVPVLSQGYERCEGSYVAGRS